MIKGLYNAAAGMIPRAIEEEVAANNLANITTTGYKKDVVHFRRLLDSKLVWSHLRGEPLGGGPPEEVVTRFTQGELKPTGNALDVALEGEGFFMVLTPQGERLTRNGNFQLNADGQLVTAQGYPVLGESGPVQLFPGEVEIRENGEIYQNGAMVDKLRIVALPRPYPLAKEGEGLFRLTQTLTDLPQAENVVVRQGYLEDSNVNPITEMIRLITISKAFQAGQKAIHAQDRTLEKTVNTVGRF